MSGRPPVRFPVLGETLMRERLEPPNGPVRLLIDTDTANEIDDQYAIAWALLSPEACKVEAITTEPFSFRHHRENILRSERILDGGGSADETNETHVGGFQGWAERLRKAGKRVADIDFCPPDEGMERSYREILRVIDKLGINDNGLVHRGAPAYLAGYDQPDRSASVEAIIDLAKSGGDEPLYIAAMGCVTNIASAMLLAPEIIRDIVIIWTSAYPSRAPHCNRPSLNLVQDVLSSRLIFDSGVPHIYLPGYHIGAQLKISTPEMEQFVKGSSAIGDYLHHLFTNNPLHEMYAIDDTGRRTWVIWDIIDIAWLINPDWVPTYVTGSPVLNDELYWEHPEGRHLMREAHDVQRDAIFLDFYDKLKTAP